MTAALPEGSDGPSAGDTAVEDDGWPPWVPRPPSEDELPSSDGEPMESDLHRRQMNLLIETLERHWDDRDDFFVGGNMFLYFSSAQSKKNDFRGPDVFVAQGVVRRRPRKSWLVWEEERAPDVVIELTSESTAKMDWGEKKRVYDEVLRVGEYYIFDPQTGELAGWHHAGPGGFVRVLPNAAGRIASPSTKLELGLWAGVNGSIETQWLRWFTAAGVVLPTGHEQAIEEAARAEAETARAEAETARAEAETARAEAEAARADALIAELAEYRRRFGGLE